MSPYASANLATHVGDDAAAVAENRRRLASSLDAAPRDPSRWVWLDQVHGDTVVTLDTAPSSPPRADGAVTTRAGLPLVVVVADCAPIALLASDAVGVVHAGWPGLEAGVVERGVDAMRALGAQEITAVLGPCIRPGRYEFGAADLDRLAARFGDEVRATTDWGTPAFDIPTAVKIALRRTGVVDVHDHGVCTAASPDHFSHRRDGPTGRQAVVVMLTP